MSVDNFCLNDWESLMKINSNLSELEFLNLIKFKSIDHIDFGCSKGGSLEFAKIRLGGEFGLGIDIDLAKVVATNEAGYAAIQYDINLLPNRKLVKFVIMSHFLEHLHSSVIAKGMLRKALQISSDFIYIQQPFFDSDGYLLERGLKLFWSDWRGHPNRMTSLDMVLILRDLRIEGFDFKYSICVHKPIENSADPCVHPLFAPRDSGYFSAELNNNKPKIDFHGNVFRELLILITFPGADHNDLLDKLRFHKQILFSS